MSRRSTGQVALACIPSMTSHVLPQWIRAYAARHPGNRIRLHDGSSNEVRRAVLDSKAELGIAVQGEHHPELDETLLFADPLVFVCRTPHPLEREQRVRWADLRDHDLIGVSSFMATRVFTDYQLAKRGIRLHGKAQGGAAAAPGAGAALLALRYQGSASPL